MICGSVYIKRRSRRRRPNADISIKNGIAVTSEDTANT
jgi:hypothetical protein